MSCLLLLLLNYGIHCPMQLGVAPQLHLLKDTQDIFISESFFVLFNLVFSLGFMQFFKYLKKIAF